MGDEDPLAAGLADHIRSMKIPVFGPGKLAAQLEADKWFAKELMRQQAKNFGTRVASDDIVDVVQEEATEETKEETSGPTRETTIKSAGMMEPATCPWGNTR